MVSMSKGAVPGPAEYILEPTFELQVCFACAMPASWKYDRRKRPYHYCPHCGIRLFIYHLNGMIGLQMLHETVMRNGPGRWRQYLQGRAMRTTSQLARKQQLGVRPRASRPRRRSVSN